MLRRTMMAGAGVAGAYWNPADKSADITLSDSDKRAKRGGASPAWRTVRGVTSQNAGKRYYEIINTTSRTAGLICGAADSSLSLSSYPGSSALSFGFHANAPGSETYNNASGANSGGSTVSGGGYARVAIDFDAGKLWLGPEASWEGGGDPAAGTSPTYTFTANTALFPAAGFYEPDQEANLRVLASEFAGVIPTGFSAWIT